MVVTAVVGAVGRARAVLMSVPSRNMLMRIVVFVVGDLCESRLLLGLGSQCVSSVALIKNLWIDL